MTLSEAETRAISTLGLAHLGDAVYELLVRAHLCRAGRLTAKGLHQQTVGYVAATPQAQAVRRLLPHLTEQETAVFRRGRNARVHAIPQQASIEDYHAATGLEALFGYLYLRGETARIDALFALAIAETEVKSEDRHGT